MTQLPLRGLWHESGAVSAWRTRQLTSTDLREMLRAAPVHFVVADVGLQLRWVDPGDCYRFWMDEVQHHLAEPDSNFVADNNSDLYFYRASEWECRERSSPIVVLERA